jgi:hypothetical protein
MTSFVRTYGKALVSAAVFVLTTVYVEQSGNGRMDPSGWVAVAIAAVNAIAVYLVPLTPQHRWTKSAIAALLAGLQVLATVIVGGVTPDDWVLIALAVGQALGVAAAPAISTNGVSRRGAATPPAPQAP